MKKFLALTLMAVFVFAGSFILSSCGSSSSNSSNNVVNGGTVTTNPHEEALMDCYWVFGTYQYNGEVYAFSSNTFENTLVRATYENSSTPSLWEQGTFTADGSTIRFHVEKRKVGAVESFPNEDIDISYSLAGNVLTIDGKDFSRLG